MSDQDDTPKGPDLTRGVPSADIPEGGKLAGLVGEDEVLIARVDGELFAIGARCTHYQGPLGEGLIVGDTIRCPWHHAHFCLKSGEAIAAPAIDPVKRWMVSEADDIVRVTSEAPPVKHSRGAQARARRVVILGGGAAGFAAGEMLRREGFDGGLTIISSDADAPYDRPNCSKDYLAGEAPQEWMPLRSADWYKDNDIDLQLNAEAAGLDAAAKNISLKSGRVFAYDALLIATGAEPVLPLIPGFGAPDVYTLRSLRDADAIIEAAKSARRVAVVGASFIGLEAAAALRNRGLEVQVIAPETIPLARVMGEDIGRWVLGLHEATGIVFHLGAAVRGWAAKQLSLDGGAAIPADFVVAGTGVRPRTAVAEAAGIALDHGILVDAHLKTNAPGVYAAGDVARYPDRRSKQNIRVEHWVHAERQGQHVARTILGDDAPFADTPFFWSAHQGISIRYIGHAEHFDPPTVDGSLAKCDAEVKLENGGRLRALATVGRDLESLRTGVELER